MDEAWALWAGGAANNCGTLSGWASSLGAAMGTTFLGKSYVNTAMINTVNEMLAAARLCELELHSLGGVTCLEVLPARGRVRVVPQYARAGPMHGWAGWDVAAKLMASAEPT